VQDFPGVVQGVRRLVKALNFIHQGGGLKDYCCKKCTESEGQTTRGYLQMPQGVRARNFWEILELQVKSQEG
jgi:hypothetical protein